MLTPVDVQNKVYKGGIGYDKKEVDIFMSMIANDYSELYRSNVELKDKITTLSESLQHYRSTEDSMQKALTISEKTAEETVNAAQDKARQITLEAEKKAEALIADAKEELANTKEEINRLKQLHNNYKQQCIAVLQSQLKLMNTDLADIDLGDDFVGGTYSESGFGNMSSGNSNSDSPLGGLDSAYSGGGSSDSRFERTNQEPTINRTSLGTDPFAEAANGGRFSRQTGKSFNGGKSKNTDKSKTTTTLNVKGVNKSANTKVKKNFAAIRNAAANYDSAEETAVKDTSIKESVESKKADTTWISEATEEKPVAPATEMPTTETNEIKTETTPEVAVSNEETAYSGEVENKVNEATMLDSEDNYLSEFDFVVDDDDMDDIPVIGGGDPFFSSNNANNTSSEDVYEGDVEASRNQQSNMIGNNDDDNDGFNFL